MKNIVQRPMTMDDRNVVLITGGGGFLGSALVKKLVASGHKVRVLDDFSRGAPRRLDSVTDSIECIHGDIRNENIVRQACQGVKTIFHLAYVNGTEFFYSKPEVVLDVGLRGMLNLIDACKDNPVENFFLASSSEVYQTPSAVPTPEQVPCVIPDVHNPRYTYGGGKAICELMSLHWLKKYTQRVVIFRPHNVYGPDMGWEHVIPQLSVRGAKLAQQQKNGPLKLPIQGDGNATRAFVHVDDFVAGLMILLEKGLDQEIYNIGTDEEVSIAHLALQVIHALGREGHLEAQPEPAGATPRRCPDISKIKTLGYRPNIDMKTGLSEVVRWYSDHLDWIPGGLK